MTAELRRALSTVGKRTEVFESPDRTRLLLLPHGGRILGLFTPDSDENFFWTNRALEQPETARSMFSGDGWQNTGGERTWVAPELDVFFPDYPDAETHWEPPQLDASEYKVIRQNNVVGMAKKMTLYFARPNLDVELELAKWVGPASNPLRHERDVQTHVGAVRYGGYTQRTTLQLCNQSASASVKVGIWNLVQLPHGGELLVPTYSRTTPRILFGDIPSGCLKCEDHLMRLKVNFPGEHKIAVRATDTTGRAGYAWQQGDLWALVIRNFSVNPSGEYVDVPKDAPDDLGYCFEGVNVDSGLGEFCELEYHAPAIGHFAGGVRCEDVSQVWGFRGVKDDIAAISQKLLGATI